MTRYFKLLVLLIVFLGCGNSSENSSNFDNSLPISKLEDAINANQDTLSVLNAGMSKTKRYQITRELNTGEGVVSCDVSVTEQLTYLNFDGSEHRIYTYLYTELPQNSSIECLDTFLFTEEYIDRTSPVEIQDIIQKYLGRYNLEDNQFSTEFNAGLYYVSFEGISGQLVFDLNISKFYNPISSTLVDDAFDVSVEMDIDLESLDLSNVPERNPNN